MAIEGKVRTLYTDKTQQEAIFPTTKVSAVTDDEGNGLNTLLEHIAYVDPTDMESAAVLANADLLGGYPASDYAFIEDLKNLKPEDIDAAPAGYGLGAGSIVISSVHDITKNGWYITQGDIPEAGVWFCHATCSTDAYNIIVDAYSVDGRRHARITKNGTWGEWEWVNPMLNQGREYKTSERWYSYPVYMKMINMGALPNNSTKQVQVFENEAGGRIIEAYGFENLSGQKIPTMRFGGNWNHNVELPFSGRSLNLNTNFDGSSFTEALITVKYIKYQGE